MDRRRFLAALAAGTAVAGCVSGPSSDTETPQSMDLQAAPGDCPTYGDSVVRVVCHDATPSDAPTVMEPSRDTVTLPGEIEFTLENGTDSRFDTNVYSARLHKQVDDEWYLVAPRAWPEPLTPLAAGESHTWTVSLSGDPGGSIVSSSETERTIGGLGGGHYAFGIDGWFKGGSHEQKTAFAATIEVRGDPVELTTTDAVETVTVDGNVLTARWTGGHAEEESARGATYVLERVDETPDGHLITEQVVQGRVVGPNPRRDALALATDRDVGEVHLTGQTASFPPFGVQGRVIEYEGTAYRISAKETGTETDG